MPRCKTRTSLDVLERTDGTVLAQQSRRISGPSFTHAPALSQKHGEHQEQQHQHDEQQQRPQQQRQQQLQHDRAGDDQGAPSRDQPAWSRALQVGGPQPSRAPRRPFHDSREPREDHDSAAAPPCPSRGSGSSFEEAPEERDCHAGHISGQQQLRG